MSRSALAGILLLAGFIAGVATCLLSVTWPLMRNQIAAGVPVTAFSSRPPAAPPDLTGALGGMVSQAPHASTWKVTEVPSPGHSAIPVATATFSSAEHPSAWQHLWAVLTTELSRRGLLVQSQGLIEQDGMRILTLRLALIGSMAPVMGELRMISLSEGDKMTVILIPAAP